MVKIAYIMRHARYLQNKLSNLKLVNAHSFDDPTLQKNAINKLMHVNIKRSGVAKKFKRGGAIISTFCLSTPGVCFLAELI